MAPKKTRSVTTKAKELQSAATPLIKILENISKEKVHEIFWE